MRDLFPAIERMRSPAKYIVGLGAWVLLTPLAFALRLDGDVGAFLPAVALLTLAGVPVKAVAVWWIGLHRREWRRAGISDALTVGVGVFVATVALFALVLAAQSLLALPRSVPLIEAPLAMLAVGGAPLLRRLLVERAGRRTTARNGSARRVLVVGAGEAGALVTRELQRHPEVGLEPVGFLDDQPGRLTRQLNGVPVLGVVADLPEVVETHGVDEVLIAMPSQTGEVVRRVVTLARAAGCPSRTIPGVYDLVSGRVSIAAIRDVGVEDLLRRAPVRLEQGAISAYLRGRVVLVTGAGGSIGSEIVRQVAAFGPSEIVLLGRGENSVFEIDRELERTHPRVRRHAVICDVRDAASLRAVFERYGPDVVFHAAAHKHVPLMEANPAQAVLNNVGGTRHLVGLALEFGTARFVNVSTDKAVNPTSVMGATKRVAEAIVTEAARRCPEGHAFVSVRFGNVLGSRGSVIPVFKDQIRRGGPVTVTDPDMVRYFMTIPEAAQLVLQAGALGANGRVFVLDMGDPVRIVDLARDLIHLSGLDPDRDIEIAYSGLRPGEKLFEELLTAEEGTEASRHEKIFVARTSPLHADLPRQLDRLLAAAVAQDARAVRDGLRRLVPLYRPSGAGAPSVRPAPAEAASVESAHDEPTGDGAFEPAVLVA